MPYSLYSFFLFPLLCMCNKKLAKKLHTKNQALLHVNQDWRKILIRWACNKLSRKMSTCTECTVVTATACAVLPHPSSHSAQLLCLPSILWFLCLCLSNSTCERKTTVFWFFGLLISLSILMPGSVPFSAHDVASLFLTTEHYALHSPATLIHPFGSWWASSWADRVPRYCEVCHSRYGPAGTSQVH